MYVKIYFYWWKWNTNLNLNQKFTLKTEGGLIFLSSGARTEVYRSDARISFQYFLRAELGDTVPEVTRENPLTHAHSLSLLSLDRPARLLYLKTWPSGEKETLGGSWRRERTPRMWTTGTGKIKRSRRGTSLAWWGAVPAHTTVINNSE